MITGRCFCGHVRYEVRGTPFHETLCHCEDCRRAAGAPVVGWFSCRPHELVWTAGSPKSWASSNGVTRSFCGDCGTSFTYARSDLDEVDVTIASLDKPEDVPPRDHTRHAGRIAWIDRLAELPAYPVSREDGAA
jgi:hypothetical protein